MDRKRLRLACAFAASLGFGTPAFAAAPGPEGEAFYVPPSPLPEGPRGSVIWSRPFTGTMALPSAARNLLLLYRSEGPAAVPVAVSGTLSVPKGEPPAGGWPVLTWTHGTVGLAAICGPSRNTAQGPEHEYIAAIQPLLDKVVAAGYAVVATDYQGLGVEGFHPFFQGVPNARNALDILSAAREIDPGLGTTYAVMGHSQGGQADLFTAAMGSAYAPGFRLVGNVAMAPGSNIKGRLDAVRASDKTELALPYVLYVLTSYAHIDPLIDLGRILTGEAKAHLPDLHKGCMTSTLTQGRWSTAIARDQFQPDPDLGAFLAMSARNEPATLNIPVPTLMLQGMADQTVRPRDTDILARELCLKGNVLTYKVFPGDSHDGVMAAGAADALAFLADRFADRPAAGNCDALPRAATK